MAQTIQIKRNNSNAATAPASLLTGELAVNLLDRALYSSDGSGVIKLYTGTDKWFTSAGVANVAAKVSNALTFGSKTYDGSAAKTILASDLGALTAHQSIYALTVKNSAGTTQTTYTPNSAAASITLTKAMVGLGNVENTALSTWAGSSKITTLGTITTGVWNGTKIANAYLANSAITINGTSTSLGGSFSTASITAGTAGTSSATSGYTLSVPYVTMSKYGIVTGYGTHTHTINSIPNSSLVNSSVTISGTSVSLGGSITQAALRTALGLGSNAYTSTAYLPLSGGIITSSSHEALIINRTGGNNPYLSFDSDGVVLGRIGFDVSSKDLIALIKGVSQTLIHSGNIASYNAGSATKLQTARTIWGQSFDGSANVSGGIHLGNGADFEIGTGYTESNTTSYNNIVIGSSSTGIQYRGGGWTSDNVIVHDFKVGTAYSTVLAIRNGGNVGIGTTSPLYKLHVNSVIGTDSWFYNTTVDFGLYNKAGDARWYYASASGYWTADKSIETTKYYFAFSNSAGNSWGSGVGALNVNIADNAAQTPLIVAMRRGENPATAGSTRLFAMELLNTGTIMRWYFGSTNAYSFSSGGNFAAAGEVTSGSDARYKKILSHADIDINTIANAPIINFKWTDREDDKVHLGSTAQYWYGTSLCNGVIPTDDEKLWTMGYGQIALASVVSVAKKVVNHEERVKILEKRVNELENELKQYRRA